MGKKNKSSQIPTQLSAQNSPSVLFKRSDLYKQDFHDQFLRFGQRLIDKINEFIKTKTDNPLQPFGSSDKVFSSDGILKHAVPGETMRHAHITHDLSLVYSLVGDKPKVFKMYALKTHDEMGTGQPSSFKRQKNLSTQLSNQKFD